MPNRGTQNYILPINGSYTIAEGYHTGQGKVTQSIPTMQGYSVNPNTSVVTIPTDQKYIEGNFTIPAFALPSPSILKKDAVYTLYGKTVKGIFEGFVPTPTDLYYNGAFNMGSYNLDGGYWRKENTRILKINTQTNYNNDPFLSGLNVNITSYRKLILEGMFYVRSTNWGATAYMRALTDIGNIDSPQSSTTYTITIDITQARTLTGISSYVGTNSYVTRIRLA